MSEEKRVRLDEHPWKNAPGAPIDHQGDYWDFAAATGLLEGYVEVKPGDGPYPAMVEVSLGDGGALLSYDARAFGLALIEAADRADELDAAPKDQP